MIAVLDLLAPLLVFPAYALLVVLRGRRPRGPYAGFADHVLPQRWLECGVHGHQLVNSLEPGCGCTPHSP